MSRPTKRAKFAADLRPMMYGFGDSSQPLEETVDLVEDVLIDFLKTITEKSVQQNGGAPEKLRVEDMLFAIRKDRPKYNRARELLALDKLIRAYRKSAAPNTRPPAAGDASSTSSSSTVSAAAAAARVKFAAQ